MGQLFRSEFGRDVGVDATKDLFDAIFTWRTNGNPKISKLIKSSNNLLNTIMNHGNPTTCLLALIDCLRERNRGYEFQNFVLSYLDHVRTALPRTHSDLNVGPILDKMQQFLVEHGTVPSTTIPGITLAYDESETMITRILRDIVGFHADIGNYISTQLREMEPEAVVIRLIKEYQNAQYRRVHHMQQRERT